MPRIQIGLDDVHFKALLELAKREYRNPRDQAGLLVQEELERRGLVQEKPNQSLQEKKSQNG